MLGCAVLEAFGPLPSATSDIMYRKGLEAAFCLERGREGGNLPGSSVCTTSSLFLLRCYFFF